MADPPSTEVSDVDAGSVRPDQPPASDELAAESVSDASVAGTGSAPSFRSPIVTTHFTPTKQSGFPSAGEWIGDFELLRLLGEGAIARVYLARQLSLDRRVALKISERKGNEARTLARLEHDHIVQVFQQTVDEARNLLFLCMQYVPGTTLEQIRIALVKRPRATWSGRLILELLDGLNTERDAFDPAALRDREFLARCDHFEAVCWLGSRLAEALAYAHRQGVLHRDVKPANILLNVYGRPLLADFNISSGPSRGGDEEEIFGGTLAYMAPEHLDALNHEEDASRELVDARSDIYALGLVLYELLAGEMVPAVRLPREPNDEFLRRLAAERRQGAFSPRRRSADVPAVLDRVIRRCTEPDPRERYHDAADLAQALEGSLHLRHIERELPAAGPLTRAAQNHPLLMGAAFAFIPHLLATIVNIHYNSLRIVSQLSEEQRSAFVNAIVCYNGLIYPICIWVLLYATLLPILRVLGQLHRMEFVTTEQVTRARHLALSLPDRNLLCACLGWLPGGLIFPAVIDLRSGPIEIQVYYRFFISFAISGLIAITYSVLGLQFFVLRVLYPQLWVDGRGIRTFAPLELRGLERRLRIYQLLAGLIPLLAALMMVGVGPDDFGPTGYISFRLLVTAMILLGSLGFTVAMLCGAWLGKTLQVLARGEGGAA
jgi:serine/threonine protein kinase